MTAHHDPDRVIRAWPDRRDAPGPWDGAIALSVGPARSGPRARDRRARAIRIRTATPKPARRLAQGPRFG